MKILTCLLAVALTAGLATAQTMDEIQYYNPIDGSPASPYDGMTVTVTGVVFCPAGVYNNGTHYIMDATGGISFFESGTGLVLGDEVEVTGTVGAFSGEIQIADPSITFLNPDVAFASTPTTTGQFAHDYEYVGNFASVIGIVTSKSSSQFELSTVEANPDTVIVYIDSTTGINLGAVDVGDEYEVTSPIVVYNGLIELKPRYQSDLVEDPSGDTAPVIENVTVDNYVVMPDASVTVEAEITDNLAVDSAFLYYNDNDSGWLSVPMTNTSGDIYEGTIPAPHVGPIHYYLQATDSGAQTVTLPGDAPVGFYELAVGITTIYEMQWVDVDNENGDSPLLGQPLNISGVITAGTGEAGSASKLIIQEMEEGPYGGFRYGATLVYESSAANEFYRGDVLEIGGRANEYFGLTQILPWNGNAINLVGFGADLPVAERANTRVLRDDTLEDGDSRFGEPYESVWVRSWASTVVSIGAYGDYSISDTGALADSCDVDPAFELTYVPTLGDIIYAEGYMDYSYGDYEITPIGDQFITLTGWVPVEDTPTIEFAGGFESIYPNPFNPSTKIAFVVKTDELTQLNIYNLRGELVRSLVNDRLPAASYEMTWDGRDSQNQGVASGQYFARLRIGKELMQVRKLSLVK